jgi:hypothetical protein
MTMGLRPALMVSGASRPKSTPPVTWMHIVWKPLYLTEFGFGVAFGFGFGLGFGFAFGFGFGWAFGRA